MKNKILSLLALVAKAPVAFTLAALVSVAFYQKESQSPVWLAPYLSGAANWSPGEKWMVDPASVDQMKSMDHAQRWSHRFVPAEDRAILVEFKSMDIGWLWCVWAARIVFPFLGDLAAVSVLTLLIHHVLAALFVSRLRCKVTAGIFVLFYLCNPLVMHVMTMPYYYGWQAIATLAALNLLLASRERNWKAHLILVPLLCLCVAVRPNVAILALPAVIYAAYLLGGRAAWVSAAVFVSALALVPKVNKPFWHTVYAGLGAYPNQHGLYLSDDSSSAAYTKATGESWSAEVGGKFHDPEFLRRYSAKLKELSLEIAAADPLLPIRNAILNTFIFFSWVYKPNMPFWLYLTQAAIGALVLAALLRAWRVTWKPLGCALLAVGPVIPYFPPIAAYVVGGYCLLALALATMTAQWVYARK